MKGLCELLVNVKDLLKFQQESNSGLLVSEGNEHLDPNIDDNLEHLLLRLQGELLRLLVAQLVKLVHQHVSECQKDQSRHAEEWFFEFPDARHPLSTTFPWNIKASLAVLWGVCWMFYDRQTGAPPQFDKDGNLLKENGDIEVPAEQVFAFLTQHQQRYQLMQPQQEQGQAQHFQQQMQAIGECTAAEFGHVNEEGRDGVLISSFVTAAPRQAYPQHHGPVGSPRFPRTVPTSPSVKMEGSTPPQMPRGGLRTSLSHSPHHHHQLHQAGESTRVVTCAFCLFHRPLTVQSGTPDQAAYTTSGLAAAHTNNPTAYATQPPSTTYVQDASAWPLPQDNFTNLGFQNTFTSPTAAVDATWNQGIPVSYPGAHSHSRQHLLPQTRPSGQPVTLPPRSRHPSAPAIITTDFSQNFLQQPQDYNNYSATSISTNSSIPLQEATSWPNYQAPQQFNPGHLSPHSPYMDNTIPEAREMQTTTPPRSPHEMAAMGEQMTRKRSHSQISNGNPFQPADGSHHGSQMGDEEFEAGRMHVNRPEPIMNEQRKYMCNVGGDECGLLTFDRKCEWRFVRSRPKPDADADCDASKHMDKHDRPYRCQDPACGKLQGFTYSGGLLRHEREVHGKHGGPKAQLMCPYLDCKRHSGKGFTRKENLNEHVRRVHQNKGEPSQATQQSDVLKHDPAFDALAGATRAMDESAETPASRVSEAIMVEEELASPAAKRRRHMPPNASERSASEDVEDLRRQIEHLQQENAQKDQRLLDMERMVAEMDRRFQEGQRAQNEWHEQQAAAGGCCCHCVCGTAGVRHVLETRLVCIFLLFVPCWKTADHRPVKKVVWPWHCGHNRMGPKVACLAVSGSHRCFLMFVSLLCAAQYPDTDGIE